MNFTKNSLSDETHNFTSTNKVINELNIKLKSNNIKNKSVKDIMDSYTKKTRDELIAICKEQKIKGYSSMKKDEIIQLLQLHINIYLGKNRNSFYINKFKSQ